VQLTFGSNVAIVRAICVVGSGEIR